MNVRIRPNWGFAPIVIHVAGNSIEARGIETFRDRLCPHGK